MIRHKSDIPAAAVEKKTSDFRKNHGCIHWSRSECLLDGVLVGYRYYGETGNLASETPVRNGRIHGKVFYWNEDGTLDWMEPWSKGKPHGLAKQYIGNRILGTYKLVHGTGYDIWRACHRDGSVYITEIHSLRNGVPHGYEWWLNSDGTVWIEVHWHEGKRHGIDRQWNSLGRLRRGYPKYWVNDETVKRGQYLAESKQDSSLPPYRDSDDSPKRKFPAPLQRLVRSHPIIKGLKGHEFG